MSLQPPANQPNQPDQPMTEKVTAAHLQPCRDFFSCKTLADLIASGSSQETLVLSPDISVASAMEILAQKKVLSAPVLDSTGPVRIYMGFISAFDIMCCLMDEILPTPTKEQTCFKHKEDPLAAARSAIQLLPRSMGLADNQLAEALSSRATFFSKPIREILASRGAPDGDAIYKGFAGASLMEVLREGFFARAAEAGRIQAMHRFAVFEAAGGNQADLMSITRVCSMTDVLRFLNHHVDEVAPLFSLTVSQCGWDNKAPVFCVPGETITLAAFTCLHNLQLSGCGVTGIDGSLVANLSATDFKMLTRDTFNDLLLPVTDFLPGRPYGFHGLVTVKPEDTIGNVIDAMVCGTRRVHRVYVVDAEGKPLSVVSPTDILRTIVLGYVLHGETMKSAPEPAGTAAHPVAGALMEA